MKLIEWSEKFELGIKSIDSQHKYLIELIQKIQINQGKEDNSKNIGEIVHELLHYTREHFHHEEEIFSLINYEGKEQHQEEHLEFVSKVDSLVKSFVKGRLYKIDQNLVDFLVNWIKHHILTVDKKYQQLFIEKKIR